jgi:hypothetical protein
MRLKIKIKDCNQVGAIELKDTATFFSPSFILDFSAYSDFPSDTLNTYYSSLEHNQFQLVPACNANITDFHPKKVAGGIGDTLTIEGYQFGAVRGAGNIYFKNADDGGISDVFLDSADIIEWSDTLIKVLVPSYDSALINGTALSNYPAGTGFFKIVADDGTIDYSPGELIIEYSIRNNPMKKPYILSPWDNFNQAFVFRCDTAVAHYKNGKMKEVIDKALRDWSCLTGINWYLGFDTIYTHPIAKLDTLNIIMFDTLLQDSVLAVANSRGVTCSNEPIIVETDIRINKNKNWFCDTISTTVPPGEKDFYSVILHELGHAHNLKHVIDNDAIMHYSINSNNTSRRIDLAEDSSCINGGNWEMDYSIDSTNIVGCQSVSNITITNDFCTNVGLNEIKQDKNNYFKTYPNPVNDFITISTTIPIKNRINLLLRDITGAVIYIKSYNNFIDPINLDLSSLPKGMYFLSIQNTKNHAMETYKISKL